MDFLVVSQTFASWNQIAGWLRRLEGLDRAGDEGLVRVTFKPWRPGLPLRQGSVSIPDWHFYFRQTLGVEYLVLPDDIVYIEQKSRQRVHLVGRERPLTIERHGAIDVIPDRCRER